MGEGRRRRRELWTEEERHVEGQERDCEAAAVRTGVGVGVPPRVLNPRTLRPPSSEKEQHLLGEEKGEEGKETHKPLMSHCMTPM